MEQQDIRDLLQQVKDGAVSTDEALTKLKLAPFEDIDIAKIDHHRGLRQGASEIIYGASKTPEQIDIIAHRMYESGQKTILITRMSQEAADYFNKDVPFTYYKEGRIGLVGDMIKPRQKGYWLPREEPATYLLQRRQLLQRKFSETT